MTGAAGGLAGGLWAAFGARLEPGAPFVLDALGFDARMRAARAVVVGEGRLDAQTLQRQGGRRDRGARAAGRRPGARDRRPQRAGLVRRAHPGLERILEAGTPAQLEAAGVQLAHRL